MKNIIDIFAMPSSSAPGIGDNKNGQIDHDKAAQFNAIALDGVKGNITAPRFAFSNGKNTQQSAISAARDEADSFQVLNADVENQKLFGSDIDLSLFRFRKP